MEELKPCPFCGGEAILQSAPPQDNYFIKCRECAASTLKYFQIPEEAAIAWNRRTIPDNKPLTVERLRQMCKPTLAQLQQTEPYAPVWIVTLGNKKISCQITRGLIKVDNRCKPPKEYIDAHMIGLLLSDYGKSWLAYVRKPEERTSLEHQA